MLPYTRTKFNESLGVIANFAVDYEKCLAASDPTTFYVVLGGIRREHSGSDFKLIREFFRIRRGIYVVSDEDLRFIKENFSDPSKLENLLWLDKQYIAATITFANENIFSFLYGGVSLGAKSWSDLVGSFDPAIVSSVTPGEGLTRPWHHTYNGRFGYVCSHNVPSDRVRIFTHSCSVGTLDNKTVIVTFNPNGIEKIVNVS